MNVTDFNFELPQELIAQDPLEDRAASRLLVLNKETGNISHRHFRDIRQYLKKGDCLVINDTKVIPARLIGHKVGTDADRGPSIKEKKRQCLGDPGKAWKKDEGGRRGLLRRRPFKGNGRGRCGRGQPPDPV